MANVPTKREHTGAGSGSAERAALRPQGNVPTLRFPGFTEEWETSRLSSYLIENKERNRNNEFGKDKVLSVSGEEGIVNQIEHLGRSFAGKSVSDYHIVRHGNIVYTKSPLKEYPYGIVKYNRGVDGIVSTLYAVYESKNSSYGPFVEYYFALATRVNRYFKPIVRIGAKHDMKIGNEEVLQNTVIFPNIEEQKKIADFLSLLDERIALQSKLIEDLKKLMSAIVERLYNNEAPKVRLGTLIEQVSTRNRDGLINLVMSVSNKHGFLAQSEQFEDRAVASEDTSNYKIITPGIFAYNPARINVGSIAQYKANTPCIVSPMYICFKCSREVVGDYLEHFFSTDYFFKEMEKRLEGSVRLCLSFEALCNIPMPLPTIEQQQHCATVIGGISKLITTESEILRAYINQKNFLLSTMFI